MTSSDMRIRVLLSVQRALLGQIGIAVRAIVCRWAKDKIHVRTVFDSEINDDDAEAMSEEKTEVLADFPSQVEVCFKLERCDYPASIKHDIDEVAVFQRMEK